MQTSNTDLDAIDTAIAAERRRPGRMNSPDAELIPLMRRPEPPQAWAEDVVAGWEPREPVLPPQGIGLGIVLCVPLCLAVGGLLYELVK